MKFIKSVVSLRYDFCDLDIGCSNESTKDKILSVGILALLFFLLYVIREFDRLLNQGLAQNAMEALEIEKLR